MRLSFSIILVILISISASYAGSKSGFHPDGRVGRANLTLSGAYTSVFPEEGLSISDNSQLSLLVRIPVVDRLTLQAGYSAETGDTLFHNYFTAVKFYAANPLKNINRCNPDGPVLHPIIFLSYRGIIADSDPKNYHGKINASLMIPLSRFLTIGGGANYFPQNRTGENDEFFGILNFYPQSYPRGREYEFPDGIDGIPSFEFLFGGSSEGLFGRLEITVPLNAGLSVGVILRGEILDRPNIKKAHLGGKISYYPGE